MRPLEFWRKQSILASRYVTFSGVALIPPSTVPPHCSSCSLSPPPTGRYTSPTRRECRDHPATSDSPHGPGVWACICERPANEVCGPGERLDRESTRLPAPFPIRHAIWPSCSLVNDRAPPREAWVQRGGWQVVTRGINREEGGEKLAWRIQIDGEGDATVKSRGGDAD